MIVNPANIILAIDATNALISVTMNALAAVQQYQTLIATARAEDRDISDEEISEIRLRNQAATEDVLGLLQDDGDSV